MSSLRRKSAIKEDSNTIDLPIEEIRRDSSVASLFMLVFSGAAAGFTLYLLIYSILLRAFRPEILFFAVPVIVVSTGVFVLGLNMMVRKCAVTIGPRHVTIRYRSLFQQMEWSEPVSRYECIQYRKDTRSGRDYHVLTLKHGDWKKSVELALYRSDRVTDAELREKQERYCALLHLPLVGESTEKLPVMSAGIGGTGIVETERPVSTPDEKNTVPFPRDVALEISGEAAVLTILIKKSLSWSTLFLTAVAIILMAAGFRNGFDPSSRMAVIGFFGAITGVCILVFVLFDLVTRQRIKVYPGGVMCIVRNTPFGDTKGTCCRAGDILDITVEKKQNQTRERLLLNSVHGAIHLGEGLKKETLEWIKEYLRERL